MERTLGSEQLEVADKRDIAGSSISNRTRASAAQFMRRRSCNTVDSGESHLNCWRVGKVTK